MRPYFSAKGCTLYLGDALAVLRELPSESVQCCVTSPPLPSDVVEVFAPPIQAITEGNIRITEALVGDTAGCAVSVREVAITGDLGAVNLAIGLKAPKRKDRVRGCQLDSQVGPNGIQDLRGVLVGCFVAEQGPAVVAVWLFSVVPASKGVRNETNDSFIDHSYLNPRVIARRLSALAFVALVFLDANVSFAVYQSSDVSDVNFGHSA